MATYYGVSSPIGVIELPSKLEKIIGNFVYINYDVNERESVATPDNESTGDEAYLPLRRTSVGTLLPDRYNLIKIKKPAQYAPELSEDDYNGFLNTNPTDPDAGDDLREGYWKQTVDGPNTFFTQDFITGFIRVTPNDVTSTQEFTTRALQGANNLETKTLLEYLKKNAEGSSYIAVDLNEYEKNLKNNSGSSDSVIVLDPNTNLPISETDVSPTSTSNDSYVSSYFADKIFSRSKESPVIWGITDRSIKLAELISNQSKQDKHVRYLSNLYNQLAQFSDNGREITSVSNTNATIDYQHFGWHVLKYEWDGATWRFNASFIVPPTQEEVHETYPGSSDIDASLTDSYYVFKDPYVLYGKTYRYEIRDAWLIQKATSSSSSKQFLLIGTQSTSIEIDFTEKLPPPSPTGFSFEYVGENNIQIGWQRNLKRIIPDPYEGPGTPQEIETNDVGGYLFFVRNSLDQSYRLQRQFHIVKKSRINYVLNSSTEEVEITSIIDQNLQTKINPNIIGNTVPDDQLEYIVDINAYQYDFQIRSNLDYYIAFCSYDVHGNISNYSEQFFVRRNNVTGEVSTRLVSSKGASLAYPNSLIPNTFVLSSLTTSGYRYLDLYQTPDTTTSYPEDGLVTIQLIDLETSESISLEGSAT